VAEEELTESLILQAVVPCRALVVARSLGLATKEAENVQAVIDRNPDHTTDVTIHL
jgi:hypothetical protein